MLNKKLMILAILLVSILTVSAVNAADNTTSDIVNVEETTDEVVSIENNQEILKENESGSSVGTFTDLANEIANAGNELNLTMNYSYTDDDLAYKDGIIINKRIVINGNGYTINGDNRERAFYISSSDVVLNNIHFVNCHSNNYGGAVYWRGNNCHLSDCSFVNCYVDGSDSNSYGGAVYWRGDNCHLSDCSFVNCYVDESDSNSYGGAVYWAVTNGHLSDCSFVNCHADSDGIYGSGGAIMDSTNSAFIENCIFQNNSADTFGGAIYRGSAVNCTFISNTAGYGGAMYYGDAVNCTFISNTAYNGGAMYQGTCVNCTFEDNYADNYGGAMYRGTCVNCTFEDNYADNYGGAFAGNGNAVNCNFINNEAYNSGGAMFAFSSNNISAVNCTFAGNSADNGGAICSSRSSSLFALNCIFIDNSAGYGGAIQASTNSAFIENCIFQNNSASTSGGAMSEGCAVNCTFISNTADNGGAMFAYSSDPCFALDCTFIGNSADYGGAVRNIAAVKNCSFEYNVADKGGAMNGGKAIDCIFNNNDASIYGGAVCDAKVSTSCQFSNNDAPTGSDTYNVIWYKKTSMSFSDLNELINCDNDTNVNLISNYTFDLTVDSSFINGININRNVTVHGNGYTIDADNLARIFNANSNYAIVFKDIIFVNGKTAGNGGAITGGFTVNCTFISNTAGYGGAVYDASCVNCTFINNTVSNYGGAIACSDICSISVVNCSFINNSAHDGGGAIYGEGEYLRNSVSVVNCTFIDNHATDQFDPSVGGAIYICSGSIVNSTFVKNSAHWGGAVYASSYPGKMDISNCTFINNTAYWAGALYMISQYQGVANIVNCAFVNNSADYGCGVLYVTEWGNIVNVLNCSFINNSAPNKGGAVNWDSANGVLSGCIFEGCTAYAYRTDNDYRDSYGGAVYWKGANGTVRDCSFVDCSAISRYGNSYGGGIYFNARDCYLISPYFENNFANNGSDWYSVYPLKVINETSIPTVLSASDVTTTYGVSANLVAVLKDIDGYLLVEKQISIALNNVEYTVQTNSKGEASLSSPSNLAPKTYTATISYDGDEIYESSSTTAKIVVNKAGTIISAPDVSLAYKDSNGELVATIINEHGKPLVVNLNIKFNGKDYTVKTDSSGQASIPIGTLSPGTYNATITYKGSSNYKASTATAKVKVTKAATIITAPDVTVAYKDPNGELVATITNEHGKPLVVNMNVDFNGKEYTVKTDSNGQASIPIGTLSPGTYNATISYKGSGNYKASTATAKVTITKSDTIISVSDVSVAYKDPNGELVAIIINEHGKPLAVTLSVNLNGKTYTAKTDSNGQASIPIDTLTPGKYTATISYKGSGNYKASTATAKVTVTKADTIISAPDVNVAYKDPNGELVATIINEHGKPLVVTLNVKLNGKTYTAKTDSNGQASIPINTLSPGTYTATISYKGSNNYKASSTTAKLTVTKSDTIISAPDVNVAYKDQSGELVATITNEHGKPLVVTLNVNLNGKDYTVKTDSNGQASIPVDTLTPGTYTATISYKGSNNYKASSTTAKVTVTKAATIITAPDVSVAYNDTNGKLVSTITNEHGKPLVVNLNVNLNGKTYSVKTDSNGQASVSTADLAPGTYTAKISYKGSNNYKASSTTSNIQVKK